MVIQKISRYCFTLFSSSKNIWEIYLYFRMYKWISFNENLISFNVVKDCSSFFFTPYKSLKVDHCFYYCYESLFIFFLAYYKKWSHLRLWNTLMLYLIRSNTISTNCTINSNPLSTNPQIVRIFAYMSCIQKTSVRIFGVLLYYSPCFNIVSCGD